jgi:hypothetical protein
VSQFFLRRWTLRVRREQRLKESRVKGLNQNRLCVDIHKHFWRGWGIRIRIPERGRVFAEQAVLGGPPPPPTPRLAYRTPTRPVTLQRYLYEPLGACSAPRLETLSFPCLFEHAAKGPTLRLLDLFSARRVAASATQQGFSGKAYVLGSGSVCASQWVFFHTRL